jgi:hypothetical protein
MPLSRPEYAEAHLSQLTGSQVVKAAMSSSYELHMIIVIGIGEGLGWPEGKVSQQQRLNIIEYHRRQSLRLIQEAFSDPEKSISITTLSTVTSFILLLVRVMVHIPVFCSPYSVHTIEYIRRPRSCSSTYGWAQTLGGTKRWSKDNANSNSAFPLHSLVSH